MRIEAIAAVMGGARQAARPVEPVRSDASFRAALRDAVPTYEVRRGDTLSEIVAGHLRRTGQDTSAGAIYEGVERVAQANGLKNANLIRVGQRIDLSVLRPAVAPQAGQATGVAMARPSDVAAPRYTVEAPMPAPASAPAAAPVRSEASAQVTAAHQHGPSASAVTAVYASTASNESSPPWSAVIDGPARLTSEFGPRTDPFTGRTRQHDGVDLAVSRGTPVYALAAGRVTFSGWNGAYGNMVIVSHGDGLETAYGHHEQNLVTVGDRVTSSTVLGEVGATGRATAPHLHFEVRRHGDQVDPVPYVTGRSPLTPVQFAGP